MGLAINHNTLTAEDRFSHLIGFNSIPIGNSMSGETVVAIKEVLLNSNIGIIGALVNSGLYDNKGNMCRCCLSKLSYNSETGEEQANNRCDACTSSIPTASEWKACVAARREWVEKYPSGQAFAKNIIERLKTHSDEYTIFNTEKEPKEEVKKGGWFW